MKKFKFIISFSLILSTVFSTPVFAAAAPPALNSDGVVLMDASTGQVLYSKNPDKQYYPASTTKVLTALISLENSNLDDKMTVGNDVASVDGTLVGLRPGEVYTARELLEGLLMESGNDCAQTLADNISGNSTEFAKLMNSRAKALGATNSNFENPSGLPNEKHVTTPRDLALIMKEAIQNPRFIEIARTDTAKMTSTATPTVHDISNHNYILFKNSNYYYPYSVASKKGYTIAAQFTNVISATKGNTTLVASFLKGAGINEVYKDVNTIFDYGFTNFETLNLYNKGDQVGTVTVRNQEVPLIASDDIKYTVETASASSTKPTLDYDKSADLDDKTYQKGDVVETAKVELDGNQIGTVNLLSGADVQKSSIIPISSDSSSKTKASTFVIGVIVSLFLLAAFRLNYVKRKNDKSKKTKQKH